MDCCKVLVAVSYAVAAIALPNRQIPSQMILLISQIFQIKIMDQSLMILVSERFVFLLLFIIIFFFLIFFSVIFFVCFDVVVVAVAVNFVCFWLNVTFCFSSTNIFLYYWLFYICFASFYIKYHSKEKKKQTKNTHTTLSIADVFP